MSVYVPVANTIQAELRQTLGGEPLMNVLHFEKNTQPTVSDMTALGNEIVDWWATNVAAWLSSNLSLIEVYLTDLTSQIGATVSMVSGLPVVGVVNTESMSANVAACLSFKTPFRGRSYQGRNYIAGLPITSVLLNMIDSNVTLGLRTAYSLLSGFPASVGFSHVVVSRYSGYTIVNNKKIPTPRAAGITSNVNAYKFTTDSVRTQRDRLP